ncbi:MAG: gliding motility-associated C-terminal domain-containing protein [Flavobacteriales bacterium]
MKRICLAAVLLLAAYNLIAQSEVAIANTTLEGCGGFLVDTGLSAADYSNNENISMTLCPEDGETIINLYWNLFLLGEGDSMTIYDGEDDTAPLIGVFTGNDLQTTDVTSDNPSGCLTLVWVSDESDVGDFTAEISCGLPCVRPVAEVDIPSDLPWRICVGEEITLDASPTVFAEGTSLSSFTWDLGDNTTNTESWPILTHSYDEPGAYLIQLYVTDDIDCNSGNTTDILVQVSTTPSFDGTTQDVLSCLGAEVTLEGVVTPQQWNTSPSSNFGGALFIPDDQDQCFDSEIFVSGFNPGQEVESIDDLVNFFINFEHSFMGDLTITFLCPNGQSVIAHAQGGGGTYLGEPVDIDGQPNDEGVGYDYYWEPNAENGTWEDESFGVSPLPSGAYSTVSSMEDLIGCPLNGIWTVEICDSWASDNGFIFDWAVTFDPSLYPEDLSFTPSIGIECDSTFWTAETAPVNLESDCNFTSATFTEVGVYDYTFHAVDNHGCEYTTDIQVEVSDFEVTAEQDFLVCPGQEFDLNSSLNFNGSALENMTFQWTPSGLLDNSDSQNAQSEAIGSPTTYSITAFPEGFEECASSDEVLVDISSFSVEASGGSATCPNYLEELNAEVEFSGGSFDNMIYNWSPSSLLSNPNIADPTATGISSETTFTVEVFPEGLEECSVTDQITFTILPPPVIEANNSEWCPSQNTTLSVVTEGVVDSLNWTYFGDYVSGEPVALGEFGGIYLVTVYGCGAEVVQELEVESRPCDVFVPNVFSPDGDSDGLNNSFYMIGIEYETNANLIVYNRWGTVVYEDSNYKGNWRPSADEASDGVYFYVLTLQDGREKSGTVTILRKE